MCVSTYVRVSFYYFNTDVESVILTTNTGVSASGIVEARLTYTHVADTHCVGIMLTVTPGVIGTGLVQPFSSCLKINK